MGSENVINSVEQFNNSFPFSNSNENCSIMRGTFFPELLMFIILFECIRGMADYVTDEIIVHSATFIFYLSYNNIIALTPRVDAIFMVTNILYYRSKKI